ncbi:MAG TPA: branched-chain amino acid ABC transporter permease [Chloroflexota bacterium]|nr:branched-chain amino acid ABC transporter permease [Chloroflexota bacterium]
MKAPGISRIVLGLVILALIALPLRSSGYIVHLLTLLFTFAIMAQAWNFIGGFTGYTDFGAVVFFGLGGYATGLLMLKTKLPFGLAWVAGALICLVFATLMGLLLLRLRGHYFGIATLGTSFGVREVIANWPSLTGGGTGISLPIYHFPNSVFYYIMLALLALIIAFTWRMSRERLGFGLRAIREDEQGAQVLGVNVLQYKVTAYALSGLFIGLVGGAYAYWITFIDPGTVFDVGITVEIIIMAVLGGAGSVAGPLVGAAILTFISEILNAYVPNAHLTVLGAIIVLVVLFIPHGVIEYLGLKRRLSFRAIGATLAETRV